MTISCFGSLMTHLDKTRGHSRRSCQATVIIPNTNAYCLSMRHSYVLDGGWDPSARKRTFSSARGSADPLRRLVQEVTMQARSAILIKMHKTTRCPTWRVGESYSQCRGGWNIRFFSFWSLNEKCISGNVMKLNEIRLYPRVDVLVFVFEVACLHI